MSWRRLGVLIDHLPPESATRTAIREANPDAVPTAPTGHGSWSRTEHLLAAVVDGVAVLGWQRSKGRTPPPKPVPRPGLVEQGRSALTGQQRQFLEARRAREARTDGR